MTKLSFKTIADKYHLDEDDVEELFMFYDTNDFRNFKRQLGYLFLLVGTYETVNFVTDLFKYIYENHECMPKR